MFEKLEALKRRIEEIDGLLGDPGVIADNKRYVRLVKERASIEEIVSLYDRFRMLSDQLAEAEQMLRSERDPEMIGFLEDEASRLRAEIERLSESMKLMLIPKDKDADKDIIVEIRAGAGGEEAALFAADLFRMYTRYAERKGWDVEPMSSSPSDIGGFKEVIFSIKGDDVHSRMKFESGVHRVQRIPVTESGGRIHTSTATVAILPEPEEVEVEIDPSDLRIDVFRSTGPGGQSVNTTDSAVRVTHKPTGIVVTCQDEKSQFQNKEKALRILRARLLDEERRKRAHEEAERRKTQVGSGERSEKIRTYNFPQGRVTDHRIGLTLYRLESIIDGELDELIDSLIEDERAKALKEMAES